MTDTPQRSLANVKFGITLKLGILLAIFGILSSGLTGFYTYQATRDILTTKASEDILRTVKMLGRRFSVAVEAATQDVLLFPDLSITHDAVGTGQTAQTARHDMEEQFKNLLLQHPEYSQIRLISAEHNGIELVRVDRDINSIKIIDPGELQEKLQYPYVYQTIKLPAGEVHYSRIFINREVGAHAGLMKPTLQVATPVAGAQGRALGVIVINVDLDKIFARLRTELPSEYQLYLTNQAGDYLVHPDSSKTFGFDYGRRFLIQDSFKPVAAIVDNSSASIAVHTDSGNHANELIGGFERIPFGDVTTGDFVILGVTVPLDFVLAETATMVKNGNGIVAAFSLLAVLLSILVALFLVRPLKRLVVSVQRFSETRELIPVFVHGQDELGVLADSIGQMQGHILASLNDLDMRNKDMERQAERDALTMAELRRLEESKQEALSRLQKIASQVPGLVYQFRLRHDGSTCFPFASGAIRALFRVNPEEVAENASKVFSVIHPDDLDALMASIQTSARDMTPWHHEFRTKFDDGTERWLFGNALPQQEAEGSVLWHGFVTDITEHKQVLKQLNESFRQLEEKEQAKSRFLAAAGHDLRQPLAAANLFIDALKFTSPTTEQNQIIQRLDQVMSNFNGLLDALLNVSKLDAGIIKPEFTSISVSEIFSWLEESFAPLAEEKHIHLRLRCPRKNSFAVRSDLGLLKSVLLNLVSNAVKYTPKGAILIGARRRGRNVLFQVWDTGIGIAEENIGNIFAEFYQVDNAQRDRAKGIGLGLPIVKRALALLGGEIVCRSQLGHGSIFEFQLPMDNTSNNDNPESPPLKYPELEASRAFVRGKRFVVVEDDAMVSEALCKSLEFMGAEVRSFENAKSALQHPEIGNADFYIVDYMLPGDMDGVNFLLGLRQKLRKPVRAVMMSGNTSSYFVRKAEMFDWPVIHKPVNMDKLISQFIQRYDDIV